MSKSLQEQTISSFTEKWSNNKDLAFSETLREGSSIQKWILKRNGFESLTQFQEWLANRDRILDAGCGNGRVTALLNANTSEKHAIVGIDLSSAEIASKNLSNLSNIEIHKKNLLGDLSDLGSFDLIYCQEVLHHTSDPKSSFSNLCKLLKPFGEIAIYVYKKKAPLREYADDYIRGLVSDLSYEEASKEMSQLTELGKTLSNLKVKIKYH